MAVPLVCVSMTQGIEQLTYTTRNEEMLWKQKNEAKTRHPKTGLINRYCFVYAAVWRCNALAYIQTIARWNLLCRGYPLDK